MLRRLTRSFVGPFAVHTVLGHIADRLFFSVKGVTPDGALTDPDSLEAEVKRAMVAHSEQPVLLLDESKLATHGRSVLGRLADVSSVLACGVPDDRLRALRAAGAVVEVVDCGPKRGRMNAVGAPILALEDAAKSYGAVHALQATAARAARGRGPRARRRERRRQVDAREAARRRRPPRRRADARRRRARRLPQPDRRARRRHRRHLPGADALPRPVASRRTS